MTIMLWMPKRVRAFLAVFIIYVTLMNNISPIF